MDLVNPENADEPVISGLMNSILAQESGDDHGSWVLAEEAGIGLARRLGGRWSVDLGVRTKWTASVATEATPTQIPTNTPEATGRRTADASCTSTPAAPWASASLTNA